jgi:nucleoid-associated protein YgaU
MGIFDSLKKALGSKAEDETDETTAEAPAPAGEEPAEQEPIPAAGPETAPIEQGSYTVRSGDTLWSIAESVYGDGSKFSKIFDANTDQLEQPDRIFPGQELLIPGLDD